MRHRKEIEKDFKKKCSKLSKLDKNLEAQKLILEALLDVRELLQEFNIEDYIENTEEEGDDGVEVGVTEEEILHLYKENCHEQ